MFSSLLNRGALLAVVSLLSSSVAAEVFEKLSAVPQGLFSRPPASYVVTDENRMEILPHP